MRVVESKVVEFMLHSRRASSWKMLYQNKPDSHLFSKGLERQRLIGSAVAGFNLARTITKASAMGLDTGQDDYNKGICSPGSLVNNPVR